MPRIAPSAEGTFQALRLRDGPRVGGSFVVTHGQAVGLDLWVRTTYTLRRGHPADVQRALTRCLKGAGANLVGEPVIEVLSREAAGP